MSLSVNSRGLRLSTCRMPKGGLLSAPMMSTFTIARTPFSFRNGGYSKRSSAPMSGEITGSPVVRAWPSDEPSATFSLTWPTTPGFQPTPARTRRVSPASCSSTTLAKSVPSASPAHRHASVKISSRSLDLGASSPNVAKAVCWRSNSWCSSESRPFKATFPTCSGPPNGRRALPVHADTDRTGGAEARSPGS